MASIGDDFEVPWVEKYRPNKLDDVSEESSARGLEPVLLKLAHPCRRPLTAPYRCCAGIALPQSMPWGFFVAPIVPEEGPLKERARRCAWPNFEFQFESCWPRFARSVPECCTRVHRCCIPLYTQKKRSVPHTWSTRMFYPLGCLVLL